MSAALTVVRLLHRPERADAWLRFGAPVETRMRGRHGLAWFAPGALFAYVDWQAGTFGTVVWRLSICRAVLPGERIASIAGIQPGAELLLGASGKAAVHRAFAAIDAIEAADVDPTTVDSDYWRSCANGFALRGDPKPFDRAAHDAAAARRAMLA